MGTTNGVRSDVNYLRNDQIEELQGEGQRMRSQLSPRLMPHERPQDPGEIRRSLTRMEKQVQDQTPPDLKGETLDAAVREERELREKLVEGMPSQVEMRKNPPGVVGRNIAWQKRVKQPWRDTGQAAILRWKNLRRSIANSNGSLREDPDIANLERYRPTQPYGNLDNAQIPGTDYNFPSQAFTDNFDAIFGTSEEHPRPADVPEEMRPVVLAEADPEAVAPCGKQLKNRAGRMAHERFCKTCKGES